MNSIMNKIISAVLIGSLLLTGCSMDTSNNSEMAEGDAITKVPTVAPTQAPTPAKAVKKLNKKVITSPYTESLDGYEGAYYTKEYRNVFLEYGYTEEAIDKKVNDAWNDMFYGSENQRIYYESGEEEAYILDAGNGDVRSEGMSYGMMMCVQMDKQKEFDKLWKWAKTHMQYQSGTEEGYFCWSMNTDGTRRSNGPAPDGEEYFAMALFFAANRWGDREEPYDYSNQARYILRQVLHQEDDGIGKNLWDVDKKIIRFISNVNFSDPSYHLPHFYELFALWADEEDREFWKEAAKTSREYLKLACHPETGLSAEYASFEGVPVKFNGGHDDFFSDAYRVAGNIGLDYYWFAADAWEVEQSNRIQAFFIKEGLSSHYSKYSIDGIKDPSGNYQSLGLISMNSMASLAAYGLNVENMVNNVWKQSTVFGKWRYYDDCLYFFSLLALSGKYRIWE